MIKKKIVITLKSDLCVGSGYSFAGVIDSDSCYDELGLPFIPARRIKGCLREIGEMLDIPNLDAIFGKSGKSSLKDDETKFSIHDAKIKDYKKISEEIASSIYKKELTPEDILTQYSRVKAQTGIDMNGVSDNNSLRFTRVINHYDPLSDSHAELIFEAPIEISEAGINSELETIVKGLRHIGMNRNRGLGNVTCILTDMEADDNATISIKDKSVEKKVVKLSYTIRTESPLMISKNNDSETENYISGQMVLGFFASKYLYDNKADEIFDNIFLKNVVRFSPLYPSDNTGFIYYPAPSNICKLKKSGYIVNTSVSFPSENEEWEKNPRKGNQPKKLKGKFIREENGKIAINEVDTEIIFHNRHESKGIEKKLYSESAICAGQFFSGSIIGPYEYIDILKDILKKHSITFGKSRKTQYGKCSLVSAEINDLSPNSILTYDKGARILVSLRSDALFMDECGYTVRTDSVREAIKRALGIKENKESDIYTEIEVKELTGYYGVWNLKRQSIPCVCAGSTFEYELSENCTIDPSSVVGEKNGEGFGIIDITVNNGEWVICEKAGNAMETIASTESDAIKPIILAKKIEYFKAKIMQHIIKFDVSTLNTSTIGKFMLMLEEAVNASAKGCFNEETENKNKSVVVRELERRIDSIKTTKKRDVLEIYEKYYKKIFDSLDEEEKKCFESFDDDIKEGLRIFALKKSLVMMKYKSKEAKK